MIILLTIFQYLVQATVDLMDKFLITARKIEPVSYTFYTVVTGAILVVLWPWVFSAVPGRTIILDLFSGVLFSLAMYVFFICMSEGEVSRVVPFIFGLVPVFDLLINFVTHNNPLEISEIAAIFLLIPGALLVSHQKGSYWPRHAALKTLSALLFSAYYALWQYAAQVGPTLNNLIWNRIGAAGVLVILLAFAGFRKKVFAVDKVKHKGSTSFLFLFKQVLGGANFIFLSFLFVLGKIPVINALQGFRYAFLLGLTYLISKHRKHIIEEPTDRHALYQKVFGITLIFVGTAMLFL